MAKIQNNVSDIKKASVSRQLIRTFQELIGQLQEEDSDRDVGSLVAYCEDKIVDLGIQNEPIVLTHQVAEGLRPILEERAAAPVEVPGLRTGFARLDSAIGGLRPGQLTVAVARPKVGKTTLLLTWAKNIAIDQGRPVLMLDTEMETSEINTRLVSMLSGIEEKKLLNGLFARDVEEKEAVYRALAVLEEAPLYHIYLPEWDFDTIMAYARKYKVRYGIEALFFDYIKLPDKSNLANAQEYVHLGQLTTDLKNKVAGKLQLPVVTAAQLNRLAVGAASVDTDQVAGSDRILHYCNNLLALTRKSKEDVEKNGFKSNLTLDIIASRNADSGATFDVLFKRPKLQMYEVGAQLGFEDTFNEY
jgi:replicative DNA helicase